MNLSKGELMKSAEKLYFNKKDVVYATSDGHFFFDEKTAKKYADGKDHVTVFELKKGGKKKAIKAETVEETETQNESIEQENNE